MRTGPIQAEARSRKVDRRDVAQALWEKNGGMAVDLPWRPASSLVADDIASVLERATTAIVVVGRQDGSSRLLQHILAAPTSCRTYVYGPRAFENDGRLRQQLSERASWVLPRLGIDAPADWLVVDKGRAGLLLFGPPGAPRRWLAPVDGPLARSLFEASRILFWFHASREGLSDSAGAFAFRSPLPAPFSDPGRDVALPAGRLLIDGRLPDPMPDAEIRLAPRGAASGRAGVVFLPPDPHDFARAQGLATSMARVVWSDTGLPCSALSRERLVLELVEEPVAMHLEWPRAEAINMFHRLNRVAQKPAWHFHASRRLGDVSGDVLLAGAQRAGRVEDEIQVDAPDVIAPLATFDGAEPTALPEAPPLARSVMYCWKAVPPVLPVGAREADLVRRWRALDEWARRRVDVLRQALTIMEGEERGVLSRLQRWLSGADDLRRRRLRAREALQELGEAPPSQVGGEAGALVERLVEAGREVRALGDAAHAARVAAEEAAAETEQRDAWEARVRQAGEELAAMRARLGALEPEAAQAEEEARAAEAALKAVIEARREERRAQLSGERERAATALTQAQAELKELGKQRQDDASRAARKSLLQRVKELEQQMGRLRRELDSAQGWSPAAHEISAEQARVQRARGAGDDARKAAAAVKQDIRRLERMAEEPFSFRAPAHAPLPAVPGDGAVPAVPSEAPPELGELFEHQGTRYLAVKTWDQVKRALPVADRLGAELVASPTNSR